MPCRSDRVGYAADLQVGLCCRACQPVGGELSITRCLRSPVIQVRLRTRSKAMENFTPWSSLAGGALIGLAAAVLWVGNGRIAGISGILGGLANASGNDTGWRVVFLAGLMAAPLLYGLALGFPVVSIAASPLVLAVGGLLVGFGTRLGGGCTSGHGVCGIARLSRRSITATGLFIAAGAMTVFIARHVVEG